MAAYTYLIGGLIAMGVWSLLFYHRKDLRKEMVVMGSAFAVLGLIGEFFFWTKDWWLPPTITGTTIGIEDVLFGFGLGGVAAVFYEELFRERIKRKCTEHPHTQQLIWLIVIFAVCHTIAYNMLGYTSFHSWLFATTVPTVIMWFVRPDLIDDSLVTGLIVTVVAFLSFAVLNQFEPGFVHSWWLFDHLTGIVFLGVPLEDVLWFFTTGLFIGPIYEFWQGGRLQRMRK